MPCFLKMPARSPMSGAAFSQLPRIGIAILSLSCADAAVAASNSGTLSRTISLVSGVMVPSSVERRQDKAD